MAQGVILAAGLSSRAQTNKMMLSYNQRPLIGHTIECMLPFVEKIVVVTGHYHQAIEAYASQYSKVIVVKNDAYKYGMFSSILKGVSFIDDDFFIIPGDMPFVKSSVYESLLEADGIIRVPVFNHRRGHPIFLKKQLISLLLKEPITSNLKAFRNKHPITEVNQEDEGILKDIDTVEDINKMLFERNENDGG